MVYLCQLRRQICVVLIGIALAAASAAAAPMQNTDADGPAAAEDAYSVYDYDLYEEAGQQAGGSAQEMDARE